MAGMAALSTGRGGLGLVLVEFEYEYTGRDGGLVSIKPNERYQLLAKTNDHWWHVRRGERSKPFYIPAKYVKELPNDFPSPLDFPVVSLSSSPEPKQPAVVPTPVVPDLAEEKRASDEVTIRLRSHGAGHRKTENRMSTFGVPLDILEPPAGFKRAGHTDPAFSLLSGLGGGPGGGGGIQDLTSPPSSSSSSSSQKKRLSLTSNMLFGGSRGSIAAPVPTVPTIPSMEDVSQKSRAPSFSPADPIHRPPQGKTLDLPIIKTGANEVPLREESPEPVSPLEPDSESASSAELDLSPDSENIYESIIDLNLDGSPRSKTAPVLITPPAVPDSSETLTSPVTTDTAHTKTGNENPTTAVYANVTDLKKSSSRVPPSTSSSSPSPLPGASLPLPVPPPQQQQTPPALSVEEWEVHTDKDSGKDFYFHPTTGQSTWVDPRSPLSPSGPGMDSLASPLSASSSNSSRSVDWEQLLDETTGRHYYYNPTSKETTWVAPVSVSPISPMSPASPASPISPPSESKSLHRQHSDGPPPLPEEDYPTDDPEDPQLPQVFGRDTSLPPVKRTAHPKPNHEPIVPPGWTCVQQPDGKTVFTSDLTHEQWIQSRDEKGRTYYYLRGGSKSQWSLPEVAAVQNQSQSTVGNGVDQDGTPLVKNWRHTMAPAQMVVPTEDPRFYPSHRRHVSDNASDASSSGNSPESPHQTHLLEKAGILNKTKVVDNGKKLRKNWSQSWTVLHGGILTFHKDPKSAPSGPSSKTNQIIPEYTVELRGASLTWASKDKSSKKNVLELKTRNGSEYLIQYDTDSIITDWHKIIVDTIKQLEQDHFSEEEDDDLENDKDRKRSIRSGAGGDSDQGRVRTKLRKFLQRRPTLQAVKEKGYIKDAVFGCHLDTLCHRENTTVPRFVEKCIRAVERRGLDVDGIYRVSGNLAVIQRLRHKADHDENLDLEDGQWEEIHVITGALKLFLRELPEPLFPYSFFEKFIAAIKISDYSQKVSYMQDLVRSLPLPNHNTMEVLFRHLRKVIEHGEANRMSVQSTAIVFGPTLLRPQTESANITVHMVFQNQIVELILNEFEEVFRPR